tara:strand:- start:111 stop:914 length:804 start_codon:yes stop_codon:yes gene_type:complete
MFKTLASVIITILAFYELSPMEAKAAVKEQTVAYTVDDEKFTGYLAYDDSYSGKRPGIVVVHEWWGHDAYARKRAKMLAKLGYTALALDMYGTGKLANHPKDAKGFMMAATKSVDQMKSRFLAAYDLLRKHNTVDRSKMAAIGYCFGGNVAINMALAGVDLNAAVAYHSTLTQWVKKTPKDLKTKIRVFNGADDPFLQKATVDAFDAVMKASGADYKHIYYPGVVHSFTNPSATEKGKKFKLPLAYDAKADEDSWKQTLELFRKIFN